MCSTSHDAEKSAIFCIEGQPDPAAPAPGWAAAWAFKKLSGCHFMELRIPISKSVDASKWRQEVAAM
jgi:hypothetical protein